MILRVVLELWEKLLHICPNLGDDPSMSCKAYLVVFDLIFPLLDHDSGFGEGNVRTRKTPTSGGLCQYNINIYIYTARSKHVRKVNIKHTYIIQIRKYTSASATTQSRNTSDSGRPCSPFYLRRDLIDMFFSTNFPRCFEQN